MDSFDRREVAHQYGPHAALTILFTFMIWVRTRAADRVFASGAVYFSGNDPWYHSRIVFLITEHFPATPDFDPWSYFPYGTGRHSGFGGLFDQIIAVVALLTGFGNPSPHHVDVVTAYAPVFFGAATIIPVYLIGRQLTDHWGGLIPALVLSLIGGGFLSRTVVGSADHQSAEAFGITIATAGIIYAIQISYMERPTLEDVKDKNWRFLRRPLVAAIIGGFSFATYLMIWPPGVMFVFALGVFVILQMIRDFTGNESTEYLTFSIVSATVTGSIPLFLYAKTYAFSGNSFSLLQPIALLAVGAGILFLYYLGVFVNSKGMARHTYPIIVLSLTGLTFIIASFIPPIWDLIRSLFVRVYTFGAFRSMTSLTVGEIQPGSLDLAWQSYGTLLYLGAFGFLLGIHRVVRKRDPATLLMVVYGIATISAFFSMRRFSYYLGVFIAIFTGFAFWWIARNLLQLDFKLEGLSDIETYQIIGILILVVAIIPGNVMAAGGHSPVWEQSKYLSGSDNAWQNELVWMRSNTPKEGIDYSKMVKPPTDGDYDYPEGTYGVMSWWDYGHWITVTGQRIPNANPFQQGPRPASAFFQAQTETRANLILDSLPAVDEDSSNIADMSNDELRSEIAQNHDLTSLEKTRYVIIDDQMAAGKFGPVTSWTGPGYSAYISSQEFQVGNQQAQLAGMNERYRNTILYRLYYQDAQSLNSYRLVHESDQQMTFASVAQQTPSGYRATQFVNRRVSPQLLQGVQSRSDLSFYDVRRASRVKVYERVPGARLTGTTIDGNSSTVYAFLQLRTNTGRNFTYVQSTEVTNDGTYNMTVPYATNDAITAQEGGTNSGVKATGPYQVVEGNPFNPTGTSNVSVPEKAIYDADEIDVSINRVTEEGVPPGENSSSISLPENPSSGTGDSSSESPLTWKDVSASAVLTSPFDNKRVQSMTQLSS